jgi:hypothetical protein
MGNESCLETGKTSIHAGFKPSFERFHTSVPALDAGGLQGREAVQFRADVGHAA